MTHCFVMNVSLILSAHICDQVPNHKKFFAGVFSEQVFSCMIILLVLPLLNFQIKYIFLQIKYDFPLNKVRIKYDLHINLKIINLE